MSFSAVLTALVNDLKNLHFGWTITLTDSRFFLLVQLEQIGQIILYLPFQTLAHMCVFWQIFSALSVGKTNWKWTWEAISCYLSCQGCDTALVSSPDFCCQGNQTKFAALTYLAKTSCHTCKWIHFFYIKIHLCHIYISLKNLKCNLKIIIQTYIVLLL